MSLALVDLSQMNDDFHQSFDSALDCSSASLLLYDWSTLIYIHRPLVGPDSMFDQRTHSEVIASEETRELRNVNTVSTERRNDIDRSHGPKA